MNKDLARLEIRYTNTLSSVVLDDYRINSVKWNDIPDGKYMLHLVNKKDILQALGVNKTIADLEAKLAEKETEIKQLNTRILISQLQAPKEQILNILGSQCIQYNPDQDKISFAVEQLEKLRKHYCHLMWDGRSASDSWVIQECVDLLDKELKQLTNQREDKGE